MEEKMTSRWLAESLSDVETKVRKMMTIIDEDADSFARRAEMFYKRRPELMKLVMEFHSAYQGLAARYDRVAALLRVDLRMADGDSFDAEVADCLSVAGSAKPRARRSLRFDDGVEGGDSFADLEILALKAEVDVLNDERRKESETASDLKKLLDEEAIKRENAEKVIEELRGEMARKEERVNKVAMVKSHNRSLSEVNFSLALAVKDSRSEISLKNDAIAKLQGEVEELTRKSREDISSLQEELLRVREKDDNHSVMEKCLLDLRIESENARKKMKDLEEENLVLVSNNSFLVTHLQNVSHSLEKLSQEKSSLQQANYEANSELQELREKSNIIEETHRILQSETCSRSAEMEQMREKLSVLDLENGKLKSQIGSYAGAFVALKESVAILESRSVENANPQSVTPQFRTNKTEPGGQTDLNELQEKIKRIETLVTDREKNLMTENAAMKTKLEAATNQLGEFKQKNSSFRQWSSKGKRNYKLLNEDLKTQNAEDTNDSFFGDPSEYSSFGFSRASTVDLNDMVEVPAESKPRSEKKHFRKRSNSFAEEVSLDKVVVSKAIPPGWLEAQDRKIVERLDSDAQKLTRLHMTVLELKRAGEYECVKEQVEESEEAIIKLFNVNLRLRRTVEAEAASMEEASAMAFEEKRGVARRKVSDQSRRMSDKIGRLQLEIQKLQFLMIKLEDQSKSRPKIKIAERKTRVLLRDFLYSGGTRPKVPKRSKFCACAQPLTKGD